MTRLTLRLPFREWSRLVDKPNGLKPARQWIEIVERLLSCQVIGLPKAEDMMRDLSLYGRSAAMVTPERVERVNPWSDDPPVDSPEGMARLVEWAKAHRIVLNEAHERMAHKHGVSTEGVVISRPLAVGGPVGGSMASAGIKWHVGLAIKEDDGLRKARDRLLDQMG